MPPAREPAATVIIVTHNGAHLLPDCLDAVAAQTLPRDAFQVHVVDNASTDGTAEMVREGYPWVDLVTSARNIGFAGANNLILRRLATPYAVLLNNDARPAPDFLERILAPFDRAEAARAAAVTAKILFVPDGPSAQAVINSTGNLVARDGRGFDRDFGRVDDGSASPTEVFGFCGGAAALRATALAEVGGFDDDLFLYFEDTDLSWRLRAGGWEVWYEPTAVAHHLFGASSEPASPFRVYHQSRNMLIVFTRHAPALVVTWVVARFLIALPVRAIRELPSVRLTGARLRAFGSYLRRLPGAFADRRRTWRDARVSRRRVARFIE